MDRSYNGKRLHDGDLTNSDGKQKRQNQGSFNNRELGSQSFMPHNLSLPLVPINAPNTIFRILCPTSKIGSVIGKGGNIIKNLRQESGAKIKIADAIPGVDERVIIISSTNHGSDKGRIKDKNSHDSQSGGDSQLREKDGSKERDSKDEDSSCKNNEKLSPAQEALFKVHARIIGDIDILGCDGSDQDEDSSQQLVTRLLVPNNQIGCLLGKGGKIIEQMRETTCAQIRVLPKDQLPGCALPTDELVQVFGDVGILKKALISISSRLQENPPRDRPQSFIPPGSTFVPVNHYLQKDNSFHTKSNGSLFGLGLEHLEGSSWTFSNENLPKDQPSNKRNKDGRNVGRNELVFRLLCPSDKIGCIIGKGGSIIHNLRKETGARIKIADVVPGSNERVIIISADELPEESFSPAIEAMIQVQNRIITEIGDDKNGTITTRLLVPTNQIGCLLGKGGNIIANMRRATRANICILPKDNQLHCTQETNEPVQEMQIVGDANVVREALFQVVSKLRNNVFREGGNEAKRGSGRGSSRVRTLGVSLPPLNMPGKNYNSLYDFGGRMEPNSPSNGVFTLPRMDLGGAFPISSSFGNLSSSSDTWDIGGGGGLSSLSAFGGGPSHLIQPLARSFAGGGNRAIGSYETNLGTMSTIEVHIPNTSIGSIIGKGGNNIAHIRQISGAKVKLYNSEQGTKDRILELSGTQEQTHTAQSLVQTYVHSSLEGNGIRSSSRFST